jgi:hypothetical protein
MTKQGLASAIGLATVDKPFRDSILDDPTKAASDFHFTLDSNEIEFLKKEETRAMIRDYAKRLEISYDTAGAKTR